MIRISSNYSVQRYQRDLNALDYAKTRLMEQGDGSKLHRPSDDSVGYSRYLRYSVSEGENDRYQDSVKAGVSWMNSTESSLTAMEDIQKTFKAKTLQAANDDKDEKGGDWQKLLRGWDGFKKPKSRLSAGDFKFDLQLFGTKNPLPNFEKAVIPSGKIFKYALDKNHAKGGSKAVAFEKALGYNTSNGNDLIANIRQCLPTLECTTIRKTRFGVQYSGDVMMSGPNGKVAKVRIAWQIDYGEEIPHLTSVYVNS